MRTNEEFLSLKENLLKEKFGRGVLNYEFYDGELVIIDRSRDFCQLLITRDGSGVACRFNAWDLKQLIKILKRTQKEIKK